MRPSSQRRRFPRSNPNRSNNFTRDRGGMYSNKMKNINHKIANLQSKIKIKTLRKKNKQKPKQEYTFI
jgi:hypothetical protein